jgi:hypothetical protein
MLLHFWCLVFIVQIHRRSIDDKNFVFVFVFFCLQVPNWRIVRSSAQQNKGFPKKDKDVQLKSLSFYSWRGMLLCKNLYDIFLKNKRCSKRKVLHKNLVQMTWNAINMNFKWNTETLCCTMKSRTWHDTVRIAESPAVSPLEDSQQHQWRSLCSRVTSTASLSHSFGEISANFFL